MNIIKSFTKENIEWLYHLFKPKTHNKIALLIVIAGLGILVSPIWEPILRSGISRYLRIEVDPPTSPWFGVVVLGFGPIYHYLMYRVEVEYDSLGNKSILQHDKKLALEFRKIINEEQVNTFLNRLQDDHSYTLEYGEILENSAHYLSKRDMQFLNNRIANAAKKYVRKFYKLQEFYSHNFFPFPNRRVDQNRGAQTRMVMYPEWNIDRGGYPTQEQRKNYDNLSVELEGLIKDFNSAYSELFEAIHTNLHI